MCRDGGGHPLHQIVDVRQTGLDNRFAQRLEAFDVERDVVVDKEDRACAAGPRVRDVVDHPRHGKAVEVAAAHFDDRAEAAVEGAAARRLDDVHLPAEHGVAGQHTRVAPRVRASAMSLITRDMGKR